MSQPPSNDTVPNLHIVGIGRTGAAHVEALLRTGEIEDRLGAPDARVAALLIDIGDDDLLVPDDYARSLKTRLRSRGFDPDRFHYESVALSLPAALPGLPAGTPMPAAGGHVPRAIARSLLLQSLAEGGPLAGPIERFVAHVKTSTAPSTVLLAYGLAGGTGSGMALDLAQRLQALLPASAPIAGVGQLSHSGDGDYFNSAAQYGALEALDKAMSSKHSPFPAGCFIVSSEQSWQRLSAYTSTGLKEVRQRFKQMVTNRFVADSFMRFAMSDNSSHLVRTLANAAGTCTVFDVAKLTHPGVQVLPGEAGSKWDAVLAQWIGFVPQYAGLAEGFRTDHAEIHVHASRDMPVAMIDTTLRDLVSARYLKGGAGACTSFHNEFFDVLTAYCNVILPRATKDDLTAYPASKARFEALDAKARALEAA